MIEIKIIFIFYIFMNGNSVYVYEQKSSEQSSVVSCIGSRVLNIGEHSYQSCRWCMCDFEYDIVGEVMNSYRR